jgi:hypothetical protein
MSRSIVRKCRGVFRAWVVLVSRVSAGRTNVKGIFITIIIAIAIAIAIVVVVFVDVLRDPSKANAAISWRRWPVFLDKRDVGPLWRLHVPRRPQFALVKVRSGF